MYSPILDKIDIPFVTKRMNATLVDRPASIWRQDPSDEVDAAWLVAEDPRPFAISREEVIALGQDPDKAVKWPEEYGLGSDTYAARIDVFHQIHCLDAIRREVWFDYYYGEKYQGGFANTTWMHKLHLTHCIAYIMENLMCAANVDVYTHFWTDAFSYPHPDFQIQHKCRSFDAILDWQQKHAVDVHKLVQLTRPGDSAPARKMSHDFKALFGYYDAHEDTGDTGGVDA
ncbi:hypothetical protein DL95DRAFT_523613 [Leptodontidium sp. 2 PMI_412]|nr:hypothetical protein DL95DRAFT_523613 [Leptodontidium sp. 2 PMI_412]